MYSVSGMMSVQRLCRLILRAFPKIFALSPSLLKKFQRPLMEAAVVGTELPELPPEILMDIFALLEVPDFLRAGSVCSSWRAATPACASDRGQYRQQQTPCLLYTSESAGSKAAGLYSLAEKKAYTLTLPDPPICTRDIIGSSYGWIITADERCELHLVNPITGEQIALPSVSTIEQVKPIFDDTGDICKYEYSWYAGEGWVASGRGDLTFYHYNDRHFLR